MKRYILYIFAAISIATSCSDGLKTVADRTVETLKASASLRFDTKASGITPVVNSVRILAYDANGCCVLNNYCESGWTATNESDGTYVISLPDEFELSTSASTFDFDLFAILNEEGYSLAGTSTSLTSLLEQLTIGSRSMLTLRSYLNGRAAYTATAVTGTEPAFLMGTASSASIPAGASKTAYSLEFDVMHRSLAQVTVTGIESDLASLELAGVQIQDISIVNVPAGFVWGGIDGSLGNSPVSISLATPGTNGFIARTSDATSFSITYSDLLKLTSTADRMYITADGVMGFVDKSAAKQYDSANKATTEASTKFGKDKFAALINSTLAPKFASIPNADSITYEIGEPVVSNLSTWSIDLDSAYYIPENIASDASTATCLKVRAVITEPGITESDMVSRAEWGSPVYKTNGESFNDVGNTDAATKAWMSNNLKAVCDTIYTYDAQGKLKKTEYKYRGYMDGLTCESTASSLTVYNEWTTTGHVYDFLIPINNKAFGNDYSVRRGTKYTVTLHVGQSTYDNLATKAGSDAVPFGISATVETDKMNGYED